MHKVKIYGGLGNQMFQFALMLYLKKQGIRSRISFSNFLYTHYHYGFDMGRAFQLVLPRWQRVLMFFLHHFEPVYRTRFLSYPVRQVARLINARHRSVYREKVPFQHDASLPNLTAPFLIGTWQTNDYLSGMDETLRSNFVFRDPVDTANKRTAALIKNTESVSLHIRRGDYLHDHWKNSHAIFDDLSYYYAAVELIKKKFSNARFFIFSDDPAWVKQNLALPDGVCVEHNRGKHSYRDMYLMSLCKHNILANSSFSWWAARLNQNPEKTVILPYPWLNGNDCTSLYPDNWIKLNVRQPIEKCSGGTA